MQGMHCVCGAIRRHALCSGSLFMTPAIVSAPLQTFDRATGADREGCPISHPSYQRPGRCGGMLVLVAINFRGHVCCMEDFGTMYLVFVLGRGTGHIMTQHTCSQSPLHVGMLSNN